MFILKCHGGQLKVVRVTTTGSRVNWISLEEKNASLELLVKRLQAEKSQLKQENKVVADELRGEIQGLKKEREEMEDTSDPRKSKKRRVSPNK